MNEKDVLLTLSVLAGGGIESLDVKSPVRGKLLRWNCQRPSITWEELSDPDFTSDSPGL